MNRASRATGAVMSLIGACAPVTLLPARASGAVDLHPDDFAFGLPVITDVDAAGYTVDLPLAVYKGTVRDDLGDLRVFNAQGEVVPYSLGAPRRAPREVRFTPLPRLREAPHAPNQIVLDARAATGPLYSLRLVWAETAADYSGSVKVETSEDLSSWATLKLAAPLANLHVNGQLQLDDRVTLVPTRAAYWRLSWVGPTPPFEVSSVEGEVADEGAPTSQHDSLAVSAAPDAADPDLYTFDLGAHVPVARVNLMLPQASTVDSVDLASRRSARDAWRPIAHLNVYRIKLPGGDQQQNPPVEIGIDRDRYWRARIVHGGGVPQNPLHLRVEWVPDRGTFLARGGGPFLLAYGSATAVAAEADLSQVPASVSLATAGLGSARSLGGPERLQASAVAFPWSRAALRVATFTSIAVLALLTLGAFRSKRR